MKKPLILISNDDGIQAEGLKCLVEAVVEIGEIVVVAPDKPQSGMGHAITVFKPLRLDKVDYFSGVEGWASSGTPADCIKLGTKIVLKRKPDLILSGINHGANSSINVLYSGTMSAAMEGAIESIPAIGFSYCDGNKETDIFQTKSLVKLITQKVLKYGLPQWTLLNINIPKIIAQPVKGIKICRQANARWVEEFDERVDPTGRNYYWLKGKFQNFDHGEDTDEWALKNNYVSIVPVQFDLTAHHVMLFLNSWDWK